VERRLNRALDSLLNPGSTRASRFMSDRIMGMHRRAYDIIYEYGTDKQARQMWFDVAIKLGERDGDLEQIKEAMFEIWDTAIAAFEGNIPRDQAFPFIGDIDAKR